VEEHPVNIESLKLGYFQIDENGSFFAGRFEFFHFGCCRQKGEFVMIKPRQDEHIFPIAKTQSGWQANDFVTERFDGFAQLVLRQAKPFKPMHDNYTRKAAAGKRP
jgi:hypothetical protein